MDNLKINISLGEAEDFENLKAFFLTALDRDPLAFTASFDEYNSGGEWWWRSYLDPYLQERNAQIFLAKDEGEIVGSLGIIFDTKIKRRHIGSIVWFYVNVESRGLGIGKSLFDELNKYLETRPDILKLSLMVTDTQSQAKKIYGKNGFFEVGKLPKELHWNSEFYDVCIMEKVFSEKFQKI